MITVGMVLLMMKSIDSKSDFLSWKQGTVIEVWKSSIQHATVSSESTSESTLSGIRLRFTLVCIYTYTHAEWSVCITKTCLYNVDPHKPHFYIVKLGFTGVYIIFLISAQNIDCGYSLELPRRGSSNEYPQSMFWAEIWRKYQNFYLKISIFWW